MAEKIQISGVVITFNEEKNIQRCLKSLQVVCDELLVVDSFSKDDTVAIAEFMGARVIQHQWTGFLNQKNFAQSKSKYNIVLQLDADEELSKQLQENILALKSQWRQDGYFFPRFTNYCGKWIHHSGWYPDAKLRLYDKRKGKWKGLDPHPQVKMNENSSVGNLKGDLLHYSYDSYENHINRSAGYAKQAALAMHQLGKRPSIIKMYLSPFYRFIHDFFFRGGFRDGLEGLIICKTAAYYTFLKYMYLTLIQKGKSI